MQVGPQNQIAKEMEDKWLWIKKNLKDLKICHFLLCEESEKN